MVFCVSWQFFRKFSSHSRQDLKYLFCLLHKSTLDLCSFFFSWLTCFRGSTVVKKPPAIIGDARDMNVIPGWKISPGVGNDYLLQSSCLGNPMYSGALRDTVHVVTKSWTWLSNWSHTHKHTQLSVSPVVHIFLLLTTYHMSQSTWQ